MFFVILIVWTAMSHLFVDLNHLDSHPYDSRPGNFGSSPKRPAFRFFQMALVHGVTNGAAINGTANHFCSELLPIFGTD